MVVIKKIPYPYDAFVVGFTECTLILHRNISQAKKFKSLDDFYSKLKTARFHISENEHFEAEEV